ncbi:MULTISPECIES: hypothetical protein [Streptomyces]|uniref:hypothetical protein n=1 Tax=Streptomyces TaxID=1883 RepID=UPI000B9E2D9A|nr:hypothetical protein [Streptomyces kasugaensis]
MKFYIGRYEAVTDTDLIELALGTPIDLWLGQEDESAEERTARLDAGRDIIADDPDLYDRALRAAAGILNDHPHLTALPDTAPQTTVVPLRARQSVGNGTTEVAA